MRSIFRKPGLLASRLKGTAVNDRTGRLVRAEEAGWKPSLETDCLRPIQSLGELLFQNRCRQLQGTSLFLTFIFHRDRRWTKTLSPTLLQSSSDCGRGFSARSTLCFGATETYRRVRILEEVVKAHSCVALNTVLERALSWTAHDLIWI